ncbi:MAG: sugar phosphate isomerase/epimerase family protein [Blastocatellales bacterium]
MTNMGINRREFLLSASATMITAVSAGISAKSLRNSFGIAWTSVPLRIRQASQNNPAKKPVLPADDFIELCYSFGAGGVQMGFDQLAEDDSDYLKSIRSLLESREMYLELGVSAKALENEDAFARVASVANQLGVERLRVACLSGRRYETFSTMKDWQTFADHWKQVLSKSEPMLKKYKLRVGVENHKDWLADEQVEILKSISSPYLGACVDFGNNVALLEDSLEFARKLAPYVVTTHLKDMAVKPYDDGFELSEVPLGEGSTPLKQIVKVLRKAQRDVPLCLEMITRDPLKVPYKTDKYWATYPQRDNTRIQKFERSVLSKSWTKPLPRISGLNNEQALAVENDNIRKCAEYAKNHLGI